MLERSIGIFPTINSKDPKNEQVEKKNVDDQHPLVPLTHITPPVENIIFEYIDFDFPIESKIEINYPSDKTQKNAGLRLFSEKDRLPEIAAHHVLYANEPDALKPLLEKNPYLLLLSIKAKKIKPDNLLSKLSIKCL